MATMRTVFLIGLIVTMGCSQDDGAIKGVTTQKVELDGGAALTFGNPPHSGLDVGITQEIRQAMVKDEALATVSRNIQISTLEGTVTLRGRVKSDTEKTNLGAVAHGVAGVKQVDNQLQVERNASLRFNDGASLEELVEVMVRKLRAGAP